VDADDDKALVLVGVVEPSDVGQRVDNQRRMRSGGTLPV
jgi:hypothetical protein